MRGVKASPADARWTGALEGFEGPLLYGWCVDTQQPDARVVLEICVDGEAIGSVTAEIARPDLRELFSRLPNAPEDACHGFVADLGALEGVVRARVANTQNYVGGALTLSKGRTGPVPRAGFVYSDGGLRLHGWVTGRKPQRISAYAGSREIASALPDKTPAVGEERQAFVLDLPVRYADGARHEIRVVDAQGVALHGSPVTVCCHLQGGKALLDAGERELLAQVVEHYEKFVPRSLALSYYAEWARAFEAPPAAKSGGPTVGVIITPAGDHACAAVTRDSLGAQAGVRVHVEAQSAGPLAATITRLAQAGCEFVTFVRAGDELLPHALASCAEAFAEPALLAVYTDAQYRSRPWFKPAWNIEYASASDSPLELMMVRTRVAADCAAGAADTAALRWRVLAHAHRSGPAAIGHVPRALYLWNSPPTPGELLQRQQAAQAALRAIEPGTAVESSEHLSPDGLFRPRRLARTPTAGRSAPRVALVIPTRDRVELLQRCIDSVQRFTDWPSLEIIVVDNDSIEPATLAYFKHLALRGVRVLHHPGAFNFSAMNNRAVELAGADIIGLINNDIEALHHGWLDEIVGQLQRPGVGVVGAKLLWPNAMVQHGGVVLGMGNGASHFGNRLADGDWGDHGRNQLLQQVSAVTAACLFIRREDYLAAGGMDAHAFPVNFNDVDLCLKVRAQGKAVVWTPFARLLHAESASRGKEEAPHLRARLAREIENLRARWGHMLLRDPAYHPSLNLDPHSHPFGGLAMPPRDRSPRTPTWSAAAS